MPVNAIFGSPDQNTIDQMEALSSRADYTALMADSHLGYSMPIGGVAAYRNHISVTGVGFDIACGNCAIRTDLNFETLRERDLGAIADQIQGEISFGLGRKNTSGDAPDEHPLFSSDAWQLIPQKHRADLLHKARTQLGTVGSGNHYVDVFHDEYGDVWVGVHFGSRGLGHTIATGFINFYAGREWGAKIPGKEGGEALLPTSSYLGQDYKALMHLAGEYAYAGREWVARKVVQILGANLLGLIHNHHNFSWEEVHFGELFNVVRKGATPAFPGQLGFVGGSMGDCSVILEGSTAGVAVERQKSALYSTVHGAGRVMSRTQAAGKYKKGVQTRPGAISQDDMSSWLQRVGVVLRGGGLDEAPQAYRRLPDVLDAQLGTVKVLEVLTPIIVVMAGENEYDPFKD